MYQRIHIYRPEIGFSAVRRFIQLRSNSQGNHRNGVTLSTRSVEWVIQCMCCRCLCLAFLHCAFSNVQCAPPLRCFGILSDGTVTRTAVKILEHQNQNGNKNYNLVKPKNASYRMILCPPHNGPDAGQNCTGQKCTAYKLVRLVIYCELRVHWLLWTMFWIKTCQYNT